jgi:cytoskeletal protein RodZ
MAVEAGGIGARLRAGREKLGLTVLQVAERIHTDPKIVEAIEAENFEALGAPVYARGHIRHYADLVGESANELTQAYSNLSKVAQPDLTRIVKAPARPESNKLVAPALVVIAVFAVAGAIWWISALSKKTPQMSETHVVTDEAPASTDGSTAADITPAPDVAGTHTVGGAPMSSGDGGPPAAMSMQPRPGSNSANSGVGVGSAQGRPSAGGSASAGSTSSGGAAGQPRPGSNGANSGAGGGSAQERQSAGGSASAGPTSSGAAAGQPRPGSNGANGGAGAGSAQGRSVAGGSASAGQTSSGAAVAQSRAGSNGAASANGGFASARGGAAGTATSATTAGAAARSPSAAQPTRAPPPTPSMASAAAPSTPTRTASATPARPPSSGAAVAPAPAPEPAAAPRAKAQSSVTLRYSADSWTEVYDASGARLFYDVGAANSVQTVVGAPPLRVVLGNASGVSVEYNGHSKPIAKLSRPDGSVQFSITRSGEVVRAKPVADGG